MDGPATPPLEGHDNTYLRVRANLLLRAYAAATLDRGDELDVCRYLSHEVHWLAALPEAQQRAFLRDLTGTVSEALATGDVTGLSAVWTTWEAKARSLVDDIEATSPTEHLPGWPVIAPYLVGVEPATVRALAWAPMEELGWKTPRDYLTGGGDPTIVAELFDQAQMI